MNIKQILMDVNSGILKPEQILLTDDQVSEIGNGIPKTSTLAAWRCTGRHELPFIKVGRRIRYKLSDVLNFFKISVE
jgi:hypothetical protein